MHEYPDNSAEKPQNDLASAMDFLLGEGEEWFWDGGSLEVAELIYDITVTGDTEKLLEFHELIEWLGDELPPGIQNFLTDIKANGGMGYSPRQYHDCLTAIIKEHETGQASAKIPNAIRTAANTQAWRSFEEVRSAHNSAEASIKKDGPDFHGLRVRQEANRFVALMKEAVEKYLDEESASLVSDGPAVDRDSREADPTDPQQAIQWALEYLLDEEAEGEPDPIAFNVAAQLYQAASTPGSDNQIQKLFTAADELDEVVADNLMDAVDVIVLRGAEAKEDFHKGLLGIIQDLSAADLYLNAMAARLAGQVKAWDIAEQLYQLDAVLANLGSDAPIKNRKLLKTELGNFFVLKSMDETSNPTGQTDSRLLPPTRTDTHLMPDKNPADTDNQAAIDAIRDIINSLDIDWGD